MSTDPHVVILGAGLLGTCSAYYLTQAHPRLHVTVLEPLSGVAAPHSASHANAGLVCPSVAASRKPAGVLKTLGKALLSPFVGTAKEWTLTRPHDTSADEAVSVSTLKVPATRISLSPSLVRWGLKFLQCNDATFQSQTAALSALAEESRQLVVEMHQAVGLPLGQGHLALLSYDEMRRERQAIEAKQALGIEVPHRELSTVEALALEPWAETYSHLRGAVLYTDDVFADSQVFAAHLAQQAVETGRVSFLFGVEATGLVRDPATHSVTHVVTSDGVQLPCDHVVLATGAATPSVASTLGIAQKIHIEPMKGHSITATVPEGRHLSHAVVMGDAHVYMTPLGMDRIRMTWGADFVGHDKTPDPDRIEFLTLCLDGFFGKGRATVQSAWAGLRPVTPDMAPLIGSLDGNVWINAGHGTLGWTLSCASGRRLASAIAESHKRGAITIPDELRAFDPSRFNSWW